jgi:protein-S-isoprenylcysteine O-methyltransferase Ste14
MAPDADAGLANRRRFRRHGGHRAVARRRLIVLTSTFLINHFELFGRQQVVNVSPAARRRRCAAPALLRSCGIRLSRFHHRVLAPTTVGRLLFAAVTTACFFRHLLKSDLADLFGDEYRRYRERVHAGAVAEVA